MYTHAFAGIAHVLDENKSTSKDLSSYPIDVVDEEYKASSKETPLSSYPIDVADEEYWYECPYCGCSSTEYFYVKSHILRDHGEDDEPVQ